MAALEDGHPLAREAGDLKDGEESLCWGAGRSLPRGVCGPFTEHMALPKLKKVVPTS